MTRNLCLLAASLAVLALGASDPPAGPADPGRDRITQVSVINALMVGRYDGVTPIPELMRMGDFGLGTLDHLDGELIILDGRAYQARGDGVVAEVGPDRSTPFAVITRFEEDGGFACPDVGKLTDLEAWLDRALPQRNAFAAIRIHARFDSITFRSVPRQEPPYRPLVEVSEGQRIATHRGLSGTMLGVRSPAWAGTLTVPGYHWHFLSDDHAVGGHVFDCHPVEGRVGYALKRDWEIKLPRGREFDDAVLTKDLSRELKRVESSREAPPAKDLAPR